MAALLRSIPLACLTAWLSLASPAHALDGDTGLLKVLTSIPGAEVFVDNASVGTAPLTTYLSPGDHTVRVAAPQFDPFVRRVTITAGRTVELKADLIPGGSTVEFIVEPSGATLTMNGKDTHPTPVRLRDVVAGSHTWTLEAKGHEPKSGAFSFERGTNLLIDERLESSAGKLSFRSRPDGADVFLNGELVGNTPLEVNGVDPGLHQVLLDLPGHATVVRTLDTNDGSKGEVDVKLPENGSSLVVKAPSSAAIIRLNGVKIGQGRKVRIPKLERGRYTLLVTLPDGSSREERIEVEDRGGSRFKAVSSGEAMRIREFTPLTRSWYFWAGTATLAGGAATGGLIAYNTSIPDPVPEGEILVDLP